jgi:hypothetical protein
MVLLSGWVCASLASAVELSARNMAMLSITSEEAIEHVQYFADDTLEGREAGSRGGRMAAVYIIDKLKAYGVDPAGTNDFYQGFSPNFNNLLASLPGSDPELSKEFIVIGAHYDHVGYGTPTNSYGPIGKIHNGADDNASGSAGLLEIAQACSLLPQAPKRSILFVFWDGEEKGLLGSKHWIDHPTIPLEKIKLAFNADMIGRLRKETVDVMAWRTGVGLRQMVVEQNAGSSLRLHFDWEMKANSDHWTFLSHGIPTLMFFTGLHSDYHRPSDDVEKLNPAGMQDVARLFFTTLIEAADRTELPPYRPAGQKENPLTQKTVEKPLPSQPGRLGMAWDSTRADAGELVAISIDAGSPAARAGLRAGDQILEIDNEPITSGQVFRSHILAAPKTISLLMRRSGNADPKTIEVQLAGNPVRIGINWKADDAEPNTVALNYIVPGSPADLAGLKLWDRIYQLGGEKFTTSDDFQQRLTTAPSPIEFLVETDGQLHTVTVQANESPASSTAE